MKTVCGQDLHASTRGLSVSLQEETKKRHYSSSKDLVRPRDPFVGLHSGVGDGGAAAAVHLADQHLRHLSYGRWPASDYDSRTRR
jgi:hypothetical protein